MTSHVVEITKFCVYLLASVIYRRHMLFQGTASVAEPKTNGFYRHSMDVIHVQYALIYENKILISEIIFSGCSSYCGFEVFSLYFTFGSTP